MLCPSSRACSGVVPETRLLPRAAVLVVVERPDLRSGTVVRRRPASSGTRCRSALRFGRQTFGVRLPGSATLGHPGVCTGLPVQGRGVTFSDAFPPENSPPVTQWGEDGHNLPSLVLVE